MHGFVDGDEAEIRQTFLPFTYDVSRTIGRRIIHDDHLVIVVQLIGEGGQQRLIDTIESVLDLEVHHYAEVNFVGFQDIVNALDGVPIWFDTPMRDEGSGLKVETAGCHVLDGSQALAFARSRTLQYQVDGVWRSDLSADLGRMSRQQHFLRRVVDRARSKLNITELATIDEVLDVAEQMLRLPRHLGIHSGGMVLCDRPVIEVCPVEWATMPGRTVLQWDKDDCAAVGLVKFDLLGLGMLSALHHMVDLVHEFTGELVDLATILWALLAIGPLVTFATIPLMAVGAATVIVVPLRIVVEEHQRFHATLQGERLPRR